MRQLHFRVFARGARGLGWFVGCLGSCLGCSLELHASGEFAGMSGAGQTGAGAVPSSGGRETGGQTGTSTGVTSGSGGISAGNSSGGASAGGSSTSGGDSTFGGSGGDAGGTEADGGTASGGTAGNTTTGGASGTGGEPTISAQPCGIVDLGPDTLIDLGHTAGIELARVSANRGLALDSTGHWLLWDLASHVRIASGDITQRDCPLRGKDCAFGLAGDTLLVPKQRTLEVRSALDASLISSITKPEPEILPSEWGGFVPRSVEVGLAIDGSYLWTRSSKALTVISLSGTVLFEHSGNYLDARLVAAPQGIRVAKGPVASNVIELISVPTGQSSSSSPYLGEFHSWFADGTKFLTSVGSVVRVYDQDANLMHPLTILSSVGNLAGYGDYFWTYEDFSSAEPLKIYRLGIAEPVATFPPTGSTYHVVPSEGSLGLVPWADAPFSVLDLTRSSVEQVPYSLPAAYVSSFASDASGRWIAGTAGGAVLNGGRLNQPLAPRPLSCGAVLSMAGSSAGRVVFATAAGQLLSFDVESHPTFERALAYPTGRLELSQDGQVVAALGTRFGDQYLGDRELSVFSLPSMRTISSWKYEDPNGPTPAYDFALSPVGTRLAQQNCRYEKDPLSGVGYTAHCRHMLTSLDGSETYFAEDSAYEFILPLSISPNNAQLAVGSPTGPVDPQGAKTTNTLIYRNGMLIGVTEGSPATWVDDERLLVYGRSGGLILTNAEATSSTPVSIPAIGRGTWFPPLERPYDVIDGERIYVRSERAVYDLSDGKVSFRLNDRSPGPSAAVGRRVAYTSTRRVLTTELSGTGGPGAPTPVSAVTDLATSGNSTCARLADKSVRCWGQNDFGALGTGDATQYSASPRDMILIHQVEQVSLGGPFGCALNSDYRAYCWGLNNSGQLGAGVSVEASLAPLPVVMLGDATQLALGSEHACALLQNGSVSCWGSNWRGQLGDSTSANTNTPIEVPSLSNVVSLAASSLQTCAVLTDGTARCWGDNERGQLGNGTSLSPGLPMPVVSLSRVRQIAVGSGHACALLSDGGTQCWGANEFGQLGDGTNQDRPVPTPIPELTNVVQLSTSESHTCALTADHSIYCWGMNGSGQLGDALPHSKPTRIAFVSEAVQVAAGAQHTCALRSDRSVVCWGDNSRGQLGDGTTQYRSDPVVVQGLELAE
ncbi:MAG TPA: hypothetical protein VFQ61_22410 [Polyangiaceae bacterium]|nr:hypothetical protein [Polyangiaceae bacterium]